MLEFDIDSPFIRHLGFVLQRMDGGHAEVHYEARPEHLNAFAVTHGGATMALLDVVMAMAARSSAPEQGVVTIEMKTTFMQPARGPLVARGRLVHRTTSLAFAEGTVLDAEGRACSQATATFKYMRNRAQGDAGAASTADTAAAAPANSF